MKLCFILRREEDVITQLFCLMKHCARAGSRRAGWIFELRGRVIFSEQRLVPGHYSDIIENYCSQATNKLY